MSCSTAATKGCSSCFQSWTEPRMRRHIAWVVDAERRAHAGLPVGALRDLRPRGDADRRRPHGLPHVDVGRTRHQNIGVTDLGGEARFLAARHEVVEQHPEPLIARGPEVAHLVGEVVGAVEALDDDALDPEVVTPHPLDELGVVHALDPDPAGARDARARARHREAARCGPHTRGHPRRGVDRMCRHRHEVGRVPSTANVPGRFR